MPRSGYDFENTQSQLGASTIDPVEQTYLQTGISLLDGLGRSIYFETFRDGIVCWEAVPSAGASPPILYHEGANAVFDGYKPGFNCFLRPGLTLDAFSRLDRRDYIGSQVKLGLEVGVRLKLNSPRVNIILYADRIGSAEYRMEFYMDVANQTLSVRTGGNLQQVGTFIKPSGSTGTNTQIKIVGDFENGLYRKLLVNEDAFDIDTIPMDVTAVADEGISYTQIKAISKGATSNSLNVGYIRLTKDEP